MKGAVHFAELRDDAPATLSIGSYGHAVTGKTTFGISLPDPIGVIAMDTKTRPRLQRANRSARKKLLFPEYDFVRHRKPRELSQMKVEDAMKYYAAHCGEIEDAVFTLCERKDVRSIIIDSGTQLFEDYQMKHFGRVYRIMPRDRGPLNADMRALFSAMQVKHVLVTHQDKEIWRNDKPTGRFEWAGWPHLDYACAVITEHLFDEQTKEFSMVIRQCQERPDLTGFAFTNEDATFSELTNMIDPDGDWS